MTRWEEKRSSVYEAYPLNVSYSQIHISHLASY